MLKISIIIPVYNREYLVKETLDSVLAQTFTNWECIVVDDQSTDRSYEVLQEYTARDSRIRIFRRTDDSIKGAPSCRNIGYENSTGDIIYWFDDDDILMPKAFEVFIKTFEEHAGANYLFADYYDFLGDFKSEPQQYNNEPHYHGTPTDNILSFRINPMTLCFVWKRKLLENTQVKWDINLIAGQDVDFVYRNLRKTKNEGVFVRGIYLYHRVHRKQLGWTNRTLKRESSSSYHRMQSFINGFQLFIEDERFTNSCRRSCISNLAKTKLIRLAPQDSKAFQLCYNFIVNSGYAERSQLLRARIIRVFAPLLRLMFIISSPFHYCKITRKIVQLTFGIGKNAH